MRTKSFLSICSLTAIAAIVFTALPAMAGKNRWTNGSPEGADVLALVADPSDGSVLYAATLNGVFRSTDGGTHWLATNDGLSDSTVTALAVEYDGSGVLYGGAHDGTVFRSDDSAAHWQRVSQPVRDEIRSLRLNRLTGSIHMATVHEILTSTDQGVTWTHSDAFAEIIFFMSVLPTDDIYVEAQRSACSFECSSLFVSTNHGRSFQRLTSPAGFITALEATPNMSAMYAGGRSTVWKSVDGGKTWKTLPQIIGSDPTVYCCEVPVLIPQNDGVIAGTSDGVVSYKDGDLSWKRLGSHLYIQTLVAPADSSRPLVAGTVSGISVMAEGDDDWSIANTGLPGAWAVDLATDPTNFAHMFASTPRGLFGSANGGGTWDLLHAAKLPAWSRPVAVVVPPLSPSTIFVASYDRIDKSSDSGKTWKTVTADPQYLSLFAVAPSEPGTLYAGLASGLARSTNGGDSFTLMNGTLPMGYYGFYGSSLTVDPSSASTVFVGTDDGVFKTTNGGEQWDPILAERYVPAIVIDPSDSSVVYAAKGAGITKSTDAGLTWQDSGLNAESVTAIVIDPTDPARIYAGTSRGTVFTSPNGGANWTAFSDGLERSRILKFVIDASGKRLAAATYRGVYHYEIDTAPRVADTYSVSLRTYYGNYVSAADCGGSVVTANATEIGPCERFTLYDTNGGELRDGDNVYLQSSNGNFLAAENGGSNGCTNCDSAVNANRATPYEWETFKVHSMNGSAIIASGSPIALQTYYGNYVVAENGGGRSCQCDSRVNANRSTPLEWETFTLSLH